MKYWSWLIRGSGGQPGYQRFLDRWLLLHLLVGPALALSVPLSLREGANAVLLPLAGIFVGLCFAWGGNANALLQTEELEKLSEYHPGGLKEYAFVYQTAILVILVTLGLWGLAGLDLFDGVFPGEARPWFLMGVRTLLFSLASLTLRECWHVVIGAQAMLLARQEIRRSKSERGEGGEVADGAAHQEGMGRHGSELA